MQWLYGSLESLLAEGVVYIDGSATDPTEPELTRFGYGIAVVSSEGVLIGLARGIPPPWVRDSAGAEAWAFYITLAHAPTPLAIVTDCLGLLHRMKDGVARAIREAQPHARIWSMISNVLDAPEYWNLCMSNLTWMPAHTAKKSAGQKEKSDGSFVSAIDWRANRLVDAAAKASAFEQRPSATVRARLASVQQGYYEGLLSLAAVTHASNFHKATCIDERGCPVSRTLRDSAGVARRSMKSQRRCRASEQGVEMPLQLDSVAVPAYPKPVVASKRAKSHRACGVKRRRLLSDADAEADGRFMSVWRQRLEARPMTSLSVNACSADERMAALRERVIARAQR